MEPQIATVVVEKLIEMAAGAPNTPAGWAITVILVVTAAEKTVKLAELLARHRWLRARWIRRLPEVSIRALGRFREKQQARYGDMHLLQFILHCTLAFCLFGVGAALVTLAIAVDGTMIYASVVEPSVVTPEMYVLVAVSTLGLFLGLDTLATGFRTVSLAAGEMRQFGSGVLAVWSRMAAWAHQRLRR